MQSKRMYRSRRSQRLYSLDSDRGKASPLQKRCWPHCGMHSAAMRFAGNRMLKKSASGVLASPRGSTYRAESLGCRNYWRGFSVRQDSFKGRTAHTKCGTYLLASSLAAALPAKRRVLARRGWAGEKSGLIEHPACGSPVIQDIRNSKVLACPHSFSVAC